MDLQSLYYTAYNKFQNVSKKYPISLKLKVFLYKYESFSNKKKYLYKILKSENEKYSGHFGDCNGYVRHY
jgi:hypothetical protein